MCKYGSIRPTEFALCCCKIRSSVIDEPMLGPVFSTRSCWIITNSANGCPNGGSLFVVFIQGGGQASARVCETIWSTIMAKFLCIYRETTVNRVKPSPEEMQALQTARYAWMQKFSSEILPGGDGLK